MKLLVENIIRFIVLVMLQVFVFDNIQFVGYINPMIYVLFILALPIYLNRNWALLLALFMGLTIDMFNNTLGIHAFSSVFVAFLRIPILKRLVEFQDLINVTPNPKTIGIGANLKYISILILIHQISLFSLEAFGFYSILMLAGKILLSSFITILIVLGMQFFVYKKDKRF